jgi:hypothetical protein
VRGLGLKSFVEWMDYCRSPAKPTDIPSNPGLTYAEGSWAGFGDWLGTGTVASRFRQYRSFKKARTFVRGLKLKTQSEWSDYCKSDRKPGDIPAAPGWVYANDGWAGYGDWLGYTRKRQKPLRRDVDQKKSHTSP